MRGATRERGAVRPSAADPVSAWLDVFIPMTGLPRVRAEELRAELEDHLRTRVDDLMITGLTEPEAISRAVGELGETAELAGRFRAAFRTKGVRLMHGVLIAVAGSALTLGIWNASAPTGGVAPPTGAAVEAGGLSGPSRVVSGLRDQTFGGLFEALRGLSEKPVLVHWERLESVGIQRDTPLGLEVDALPSHLLYRLLRERTEAMVGDPVTVEDSGELVEVSTRSHFDERTTGVRSYDIRDLVELKSGMAAVDLASGEAPQWTEAGHDVLLVVKSLAERSSWEDEGGGLASGTLSGARLLVRAPNRIHEMVEGVLSILREDADETRRLAAEQNESRQAEGRAQAEQLEAQRQQAIERLSREMEEYLVKIIALEARKRDLEREIERIKALSSPHTAVLGETPEQAEQRVRENLVKRDSVLPGMQSEAMRVQYEIEDTIALRQKARERLADLRY